MNVHAGKIIMLQWNPNSVRHPQSKKWEWKTKRNYEGSTPLKQIMALGAHVAD